MVFSTNDVLDFFNTGGADPTKKDGDSISHQGTMEEFYDMNQGKSGGAPPGATNSSASDSSTTAGDDEGQQTSGVQSFESGPKKGSSGSMKPRPTVSFEIKNNADRRKMLERQLEALKATVVRPLKREIDELRQDGAGGKDPKFEISLCNALAFMEVPGAVGKSTSKSSMDRGDLVVDPALGDQVEEDLRKLKASLEKGGTHWKWVYAYHLERFRNLHGSVVDQYKDKLVEVHDEVIDRDQKLKDTKRLLADSADKVVCLKSENATLRDDLASAMRDYDRLVKANRLRPECKSTPVLGADEFSCQSEEIDSGLSSEDSGDDVEVNKLRASQLELKARVQDLEAKLTVEIDYNAKLSEMIDNRDDGDSQNPQTLTEYQQRIAKLESKLAESQASRDIGITNSGDDQKPRAIVNDNDQSGRVKELEAELARSRALLKRDRGSKDQSKRIAKLEAELSESRTSHDRVSMKSKDENKRIAKLEADLADARSARDIDVAKARGQSKCITKLEKELVESRAARDKDIATYKGQDEQISKLEAALAMASSSQELNEKDAQKRVAKLEAELAKAHGTRERDSATYRDQNQRIEQLEEQLATAQSVQERDSAKCNDLNKRVEELEAELLTAHAVREQQSITHQEQCQQIQQVEAELAESRTSQEKYKDGYKDQRKRLDKLESELAQVQVARTKEIGDYDDQRDAAILQLHGDLKHALLEKEDAQKRVAKLEAVKQETGTVTKLVQVLNEKVKKKMDEVQRLASEGNTLRQQLETTQENLERETELRQTKSQLLKEAEESQVTLSRDLSLMSKRTESQIAEIKEYSRSANAFDTLKADNDSLRCEISTMREELATAQEIVVKSTGIRVELIGLQEKLDSAKEQLACSNAQNDSKSKELEVSSAQLVTLHTDIETLKDQLMTVEEELSRSIATCNIKTTEIETLKELNEMMGASVDGLRSELTGKQQELIETQEMCGKVQKQLDESRATKERLSEEMSKAEMKHKEQMALTTGLLTAARESEERQVSALRHDVDVLQEQLTTTKEELSQSTATCNMKTTEFDSLQELNDKLIASIDVLRADLSEKHQELTDCNVLALKTQEQFDAATVEKERITRELDNVQASYQASMKKSKEALRASKISEEAQVSELKLRLSRAQDELVRSVARCEEQSTRLEEYLATKVKLDDELRELQNLYDTQSSEKEEVEKILQTKSAALADSIKLNDSLKTELLELGEQFNAVQMSLDTQSSEKGEVEKILQTKSAALVDSIKLNDSLKTELVELNEQFNAVQISLTVAEKELAESRTVQSTQRESLSTSKTTIESLRAEVEQLKEKLAVIEQELTSTTERLEHSGIVHLEQLEGLATSKSTIKFLRTTIEEHSNKLMTVETELKSATETTKDQKYEIAQFKSKTESLQEEIESLLLDHEEKSRSAKGAFDEIANAKAVEREESRNAIESLGNTVAELKDQLAEVQSLAEKYSEELHTSNLRKASMRETIANLEHGLQAQMEEMSSEMASAMEAKDSELEYILSQNREMVDDIEVLRQQLKEQTRALESNAIALKDVHIANESFRSKVKDLEDALAEAERDLAENLESKKLKEAKVAQKMLTYEIEDLKKELKDESRSTAIAQSKLATAEEHYRSSVNSLTFEINSMKCQLGIAGEDKDRLAKLGQDNKAMKETVVRLSRQLKSDDSIAMNPSKVSESDGESQSKSHHLLSEENSRLATALDDKVDALDSALEQNAVLRDELVNLTCMMRRAESGGMSIHENDVHDGASVASVSSRTSRYTPRGRALRGSGFVGGLHNIQTGDDDVRDDMRDGASVASISSRTSRNTPRGKGLRGSGFVGEDVYLKPSRRAIINTSIEESEIPTYN